MAIPSEYSYLLETVDFLWRNTQIYAIASGKSMRYYSSSYNICYQPANECSFLSYNEQSSSFQESKMIATTIGSIHITDNGGTITVSYDNFKLNFWSEYNQKWIEWIEPDGTYGDYLEVPHTGSWKSSQTVDFRNFTTSFNSLSDACNYIYCNFKHCYIYYNNELWVNPNPPEPITSNGGGATHIAKVTGQLKDLSSNLSDILMVSGGGGGGLLVGDTDYSGKEAGGISGSGDNSADQSTGNAFGQGESGTNLSGGGSGLYGGYKGTSAKSGGAGSGYIGNSLVSNKKMVGYNVPTSSAEGTKTESVNEASADPVSGKPKIGNGFAKIKYLGEGKIFDISAENQLKDSVNNKSPQVIYGSIGTYDSNTQSYYFSSSCYLGYDSKITKAQIQRATKIKIESVVKTDSTVVGESVDTEIGISTSASSVYTFDYAIVGIICNGIESSVSKHIAKLNYEDYSWQGDAPEDISDNQGAFHTIIHEFTLSSGTVTKIKVTIDGAQFAEASPSVTLSLSNDDYYFVVGVCDKTNVKSVKVVIL